MSSPDAIPPDELDALLSSGQALVQPALRGAILQQTTRIVRRRRYVRRAMLCTAMLVCYAAGAMTVGLFGHPGERPSPAVVKQPPAAQPTAPGTAGPVEVADDSQDHRHALPLSQYERLRRYSDRLLDQEGDVARAARYYARALDKASPAERAISAEDSWLLMALKADRFPEKNHEHRGS